MMLDARGADGPNGGVPPPPPPPSVNPDQVPRVIGSHRTGGVLDDDETVTPAGQPRPKSFKWQSNEETFTDPSTGALTTKATEHEVLHDGTKIVTKVTTLKRDHVYGATTVSSSVTERFATVTAEERVVDVTYRDCFLWCCPCFRLCFGKKKGEGGGGEGGDRWKPIEPD